jgi:hypothetical protein
MTEIEPVHPQAVQPHVFGPSDDVILRFQQDIERLVTPALRTLHELCEMADSESVRLNAATSIVNFAGLRAPKRRYAPAQEVEQDVGVAQELALLLERLERNRPGLVTEFKDAIDSANELAVPIDAQVIEDMP